MLILSAEEKASGIGKIPFSYAGELSRARGIPRTDVWRFINNCVKSGMAIIGKDNTITEWREVDATPELPMVNGMREVPLEVWVATGRDLLSRLFESGSANPIHRFDLVDLMANELDERYPDGWVLGASIGMGDALKALLDGGATLDYEGEHFISAPA